MFTFLKVIYTSPSFWDFSDFKCRRIVTKVYSLTYYHWNITSESFLIFIMVIHYISYFCWIEGIIFKLIGDLGIKVVYEKIKCWRKKVMVILILKLNGPSSSPGGRLNIIQTMTTDILFYYSSKVIRWTMTPVNSWGTLN